MFYIVAAIDQNRGIGKGGKLPWPKLKGDMKFYRELTSSPDTTAVERRYGLSEGSSPRTFSSYPRLIHYLKTTPSVSHPDPERPNAVIMGRKTWESLPEQFRPLPYRTNLILSRRLPRHVPNNVLVSDNLDNALVMLKERSIRTVFVVGGGELFHEAVHHPACDRIYLTVISANWDCDTYFPEWTTRFRMLYSGFRIYEHTVYYQFNVLVSVPQDT